ncbi:hypothetical protein [Natronorubrum texcoconense]|nr:hypothetical protein [Natronorubrum texcoconense]
MNRRQLLKSTSVGIASVAGITGNANASTSNKDIMRIRDDIKEYMEIQEKDGEGIAKQFLKEKGYTSHSKEVKVDELNLGSGVDSDKDTKINPESIEDPSSGGIEFNFTGIKDYNSDMHTFTLTVNYNFEFIMHNLDWGSCGPDRVSYGASPRDGAGLFYKSPDNHWKLATNNYNNDIITTTRTEFDENESSASEGTAGFRFDDEETYTNWENSIRDDFDCWDDDTTTYTANRYGGSISVILEPQGSFPESERAVYARYTHAYQLVGFSPSLSIGIPPSVSISATGSVSQEQMNSDENGNVLVLYQDEIPEEEPCTNPPCPQP